MAISPYNIDALKNADGTYADAPVHLIKGALKCGHTAHLQTSRGIVAIRPYTVKKVRLDHEGRPRFPEEQVGRNVLIEFAPTGSETRPVIAGYRDQVRGLLTMDRPEPSKWDTPEMVKRVRAHYRARNEDLLMRFVQWIYSRLNGRAHTYVAGDQVSFWANQADRDAEVLAVLGDEVLIEYVMPQGTSALVLCRGTCNGLTPMRNYPHTKLPKKWVRAMHEQGTEDWVGMGQRCVQAVPFPVQEVG